MRRITLRPGTWSNFVGILLAGGGTVTAATATQHALQVVGYIGLAAGVALLLSGILYGGVPVGTILRGKKAWRIAYADRDLFEEEVVYVNDLVNDAVPHVVGKRFKRCIIRGPQRLCFQGTLSMLCPLAEDSPLVMVPEGADFTGAARFIDAVFDNCFFEDVFLELPPPTYEEISAYFEVQPYAYWKQARNYRGPRK
jgi:hypothetical protein